MKKKGIIALVIGILVVLAVIGFIYWRKKKNPDTTQTGGGTGTGGGGGYTPASSYPIKYGQSGELVKGLQSRLNAKGANPKLAVDGAYGPKTKEAVKAALGGDGMSVTQQQFESLSPANGLFPSMDAVEFATQFSNAMKKGYINVSNPALVKLYEFLLTLDDANILQYGATTFKLFPSALIYQPIKYLVPSNYTEQVSIGRALLKMKTLYPEK